MKLDEWLKKDIETEAEFYSIDGVKPEPSAWSIDDDLAADWAVRKIQEINKDIDRQEAIARQWIAYYDAQLTALEEKREKQSSFLRVCLSYYFERVDHRKTKSGVEKYDLLSGRLSKKPATQKIIWADEEKLLAHLKATGQTIFVRTKESVDKAGFKKKLSIVDGEVIDAETGEIVPGCTAEDVPAEFKVEMK